MVVLMLKVLVLSVIIKLRGRADIAHVYTVKVEICAALINSC